MLHNPKVQEGMTFEAVVTSANEVIDIDGYNYASVDKDSRSRNGGNGFRIVGSEKNGSNHVYGDFRFATDG